MGAELSVDDSYALGEPFKCEKKFWKIYPALSKKDEVSATVLIHDNEENENYGVEKAVKYLRTLRHPGLLKCHEIVESIRELSVVTEPVVPLLDVIGDLNIHELIAGIHATITTVAFLHDKCKLSHNNLSIKSIFVGQNDACWKIADFECMCAFSDMSKEFMAQIKPFREAKSIPPEGEDVQITSAHAQDAFGVGKLILDIIDQIETTEEAVISNFQQRVEAEFLHPNYQERPHVNSLLNDDLFQNGYIEILDFLNHITVKTGEEKASFFRHLHHKLQNLPSKMVANRLLHLLLSRFVLVDPVAVEMFLPHLLTPLSDEQRITNDQSTDIIPLLPQKLYKESCIPILRKLFEVNDRHVRLILLKYFPLYGTMFEKEVLKNDIMHQLMLGLRDSDDELVSATFSALQYLVPLLGSQIVIGGERSQQFTERRPKFDSQTLITGHEKRSVQISRASHLNTASLSNQPKASDSKTAQEKIQDRERRRQETRRRNEERRKQKQLLQMEKAMAKKIIAVEEVHDESDDEFDSWGDLSTEREQNIEASDGSEHGRPSSSEISLDSGFSERTRIPPSFSSQISPRTLKEKAQEFRETSISNKRLAVKGGMKLAKPKQSSKKQINPQTVLPSTSSPGDCNLMSPNQSKILTRNNGAGNLAKKKTVDTPWDAFGINVRKTEFDEDDIFADMAPSLSSALKAPVKGTSIYSGKLAVVNTTNEVADGWMDDDW